MAVVKGRKRVVVFLEESLYQRVKIAAIRRNRAVSDYVTDALVVELQKTEREEHIKNSTKSSRM